MDVESSVFIVNLYLPKLLKALFLLIDNIYQGLAQQKRYWNKLAIRHNQIDQNSIY